jgi:hypothetical protein
MPWLACAGGLIGSDQAAQAHADLRDLSMDMFP